MQSEKFNTYSSLIFVELSFTSGNFNKALVSEFPELADIFKKLTLTPSSESQTHLESLFKHNEDSLKSFLNDYLKENENEFNWTTFLDKYDVTPVAGKFFKIEKTEKAYLDFVHTMQEQRWVFSHMSIAIDKDNFILFFA